MANYLSQEEINALKKYRLSTEKITTDRIISGEDLLSKDHLQEIFNEDLMLKLNTNKYNVIGSMLVKRYAFLAALVLYSMSVFEKGINSRLDNISIQTDDKDPLWLPRFHFESLEVITPTADRKKWRTSVVQTLFQENITKIVTSISKHTRVSKTILWENISVYIFWMYETLFSDKSFSEISTRVEADFHYVVLEASPHLFGNKAKNPLAQYYRPKENDVRMRTTCCLFYLTSKNDDRCTTCPIECKKAVNG